MKNLLFGFLLISAVSRAVAQVNYVSNPQFDSGKTKWFLAKYNGSTATFSIDNTSQLSGPNSAKVDIETSAGTKSDVKLFQDVEITSNVNYGFYFMAKSDLEKEIEVSFENDVDQYWKTTILIKPGQTHYGPFTFESNTDDLLAYFSFHLGGSTGSFYIDSVVVHEQLPTALDENILASDTKPVFQQTMGGLKIILPEPVVSIGDIIVTDPSGKMVTSKRVNPNEEEINIENLNSGVYLLQLTIDQTVIKEKVILH